MKAVVYKGPRELAVEDVSDARVEDPTDALIRITTTNICGSDLHIYEFTTGQARRAMATSRRVVLPLFAHLDRAGRTVRLPDDTRRIITIAGEVRGDEQS